MLEVWFVVMSESDTPIIKKLIKCRLNVRVFADSGAGACCRSNGSLKISILAFLNFTPKVEQMK